jgi:hypothetical protein
MEILTNENEVIISPFEEDPALSRKEMFFLKVSNAPGGIPLESLPPP